VKGWQKQHFGTKETRGTVWVKIFGQVTLHVSKPMNSQWLWSLDGTDFSSLCPGEFSLHRALRIAVSATMGSLCRSIEELGKEMGELPKEDSEA